jgi:hypothetical protein
LTIAANNELESQRKLDASELKRLRALLEAKNHEIQSLKDALEKKDAQSHIFSNAAPSATTFTSLLTTPQRQNKRPISSSPTATHGAQSEMGTQSLSTTTTEAN